MKRAADFDFFFDELRSPDWVSPLREEGLFNDPPGPIVEGDYVSFPAWAPARYLKRVGGAAPEAVRDAILAMPRIDNPRVQEDLVDAALEMPPAVAASLGSRILEWINSPYQLLLPDKVARLAVKLAQSGQEATGLRLARHLLEILPPSAAGPERPKPVSLVREPRPKFDPHQYELILTRYVPDLVRAAGEGSLDLLADALQNAVSSSSPLGDDGEDYSYVWRPSIEQTNQVHDHDLRGSLVRAVRDAAELVASKDPQSIEVLIRRLEARPWKVFKRIALHLLRLHHREAQQLVRERLLDPRSLEDPGTYHEFILLVRDGFKDLDDTDKATFLRNLDAQYERDQADALALADSSERDRDLRSARHWLYRRLSFLSDALPPDWRKRYDGLVGEFGPLDHADFLTYTSGVWHGPTAPKSEEEVAGMTVEEFVTFAKQWQPSDRWMGDSREGLARVLSSAVTASPSRFATEANRFRELDPTYVHWLFWGLAEALKADRSFQWEPVLDLAGWVVTQPREIPGRVAEYSDRDPGWVWTRSAIAGLLEDSFRSDKVGVPYSLRAAAWRIVETLAEDPDPSPEEEDERGANLDPFTLAINSVRGKAMNAAVQYGLWVSRHTKEGGQGTQPLTFEGLQELQRVLDAHLSGSDRSLAVRSVYGRWFPWLHLLDAAWATANVQRIFPRASGEQKLRVSAWDAYLLFAGIYDSMLDVLRSEYEAAIQRLRGAVAETSQKEEARRLAEHLMIFAMRGRLRVDEEDGLLQRFFRVAPPDLRAVAMGSVGTALHGEEKPPLPDDVRTRLETLWEWRVRESQSLQPGERAPEIAEFGWWFASGKFSDAWAVPQLVTALRLAGRLEVSHMAMERLENVAKSYPLEAVQALKLAILGDEKGWDYALRVAHAEGILRDALASMVPEAKEEAIQLINLLAARGNRAYVHLVPEG